MGFMLSTLIQRCWDQTSCEFCTRMMTDLLRGVFNDAASGVVFKQGEIFAKYFGCHGREAEKKYTSIYSSRELSRTHLSRTPPVRVWSTATDSVRTLPIKVCISWPMALCNAADRVVCIGDGVAVPLIHHNPIAAFTTRCADIVDDATRILNGGGTAIVLQGYKSRGSSS